MEENILQDFIRDPMLCNGIKVENYLMISLGLRSCSRTTLPAEFPRAEKIGATIDQIEYKKIRKIQVETDPQKKRLAIAILKREMMDVYKEIVEKSGQYQAHMNWAKRLGLHTHIVNVRPTVQELYLFKDRNIGKILRKLMKEREKLRVKAYSNAKYGMDMARFAYPEEFNGSWIRDMGKILGYPNCCIDAYISDKESEINVEFRAAKQLIDAENIGVVDSLVYFVGYFFPCKHDCENALAKGRECQERLMGIKPSISELYAFLTSENMEKVRNQPEFSAESKAKIARALWRV